MKFDNIMMKCAIEWANMSYCKRLKVGAILASEDGRILATGYNGTISSHENVCEEYVYKCPKCKKNVTKEVNDVIYRKVFNENLNCSCSQPLTCEDIYSSKGIKIFAEKEYIDKTSEFTLHAEQNIISYCAKNGISTNGMLLYITKSPCKTCAKLIAQSGIRRVIYLDEYRDTDGIEFLKKCDVQIEKFKEK